MSVFTIEDEILSQKGIKKAIAKGKIKITPFPDLEQFQSGSLDVRIGSARIFDDESRQRYYEDCLKKSTGDPRHDFWIGDQGMPTSYGKFIPDEEDALLRLTSYSFSEIFFREKIEFDPEEYWISVDLRSSRGRLGLSRSSEVPKQENGTHYVEIVNKNKSAVLLYGHSKFAQVFFHPLKKKGDSYIVNNPNKARRIAEKVCEGPFEMDGPFIKFVIGDRIWKRREGVEEINTKEDTGKYYDEIPIAEGERFPFFHEDSIVAQLSPGLNLPKNIAIQLFHEKPFYATRNERFSFPYDERFDVNAAWIDQGYSGNPTAHPWMLSHFPRVLEGGKLVCYGICYRNRFGRSGDPYGSKSMNSHYQGSQGSTSRS